jgi:hypothetical protein
MSEPLAGIPATEAAARRTKDPSAATIRGNLDPFGRTEATDTAMPGLAERMSARAARMRATETDEIRRIRRLRPTRAR